MSVKTALASVAGLAPARVCLKGRARELLCIHGFKKWMNGFVDNWIDATEAEEPFARESIHPIIQQSFFGVAPEVGIAPTSPRLQRGANLPQLLGVLAHGHI